MDQYKQYIPSYSDWDELYDLMKDLFNAAAVVCFLWALNRAARGLMLNARVEALEEFEDAYTPEEREELIHRIKTDSLRF